MGAQIQLDPGVHRIDLLLVKVGQAPDSLEDMLAFDIAEPGALDLDTTITFLCRVSDFASNVLSLAITVCPNDKCSSISSLGLYVFGDDLLVLSSVRYESEVMSVTDSHPERRFAQGRRTDALEVDNSSL